MHELIVDLHISSEEYLKLYQGIATSVSAHARDGRRIRFPARILQQFVTRDGVRGSFRIVCDANLKFQSIHRL